MTSPVKMWTVPFKWNQRDIVRPFSQISVDCRWCWGGGGCSPQTSRLLALAGKTLINCSSPPPSLPSCPLRWPSPCFKGTAPSLIQTHRPSQPPNLLLNSLWLSLFQGNGWWYSVVVVMALLWVALVVGTLVVTWVVVALVVGTVGKVRDNLSTVTELPPTTRPS